MNKTSKLCAALFLSCASMICYAAGDAKHIPGIFIGATNFESETDFTFGLEYEFKLTKTIGFGGVWERTIEGHDGDGVNVIVGSLFYHPSDQWRFGVGFGEEQIRGKKPKDKDLWRLSATYEYPMDNMIIAPTLALDFIDGDTAKVAGVAILVPF